jgi:hypothetical protein
MLCFQLIGAHLLCIRGPSARALMISIPQVHLSLAILHSQKQCRTISLAPVQQTGQFCTMLILIIPLHELTSTARCQILQSRPASLRTRCLSQTVDHLRRNPLRQDTSPFSLNDVRTNLPVGKPLSTNFHVIFHELQVPRQTGWGPTQVARSCRNTSW